MSSIREKAIRRWLRWQKESPNEGRHDADHCARNLSAGPSGFEDWTRCAGNTTRHTGLEFGNSGCFGSREAWAAHLELAGDVTGRWGSGKRMAVFRRPADLADLRISFRSRSAGSGSPEALAAARYGRSSKH